ncbi:MAG: 16S rRNA (cytidine(1402)-2'-O)-methyltransferase [Pseudomonadota bacterium]
MEPGLYIVATPIGNLADLSQRAIDTLRAADIVACEDTRHSRRLLQHYDIEATCVPYHEHSDEDVAERLLARLDDGGNVALVSDAGTPLISDPGYRLVRQAQDAGHLVVPIAGPCAAIAALSASGLATDRFRFEGFLPPKAGARRRALESLADISMTLVFYEAPHRVAASLEEMVSVFGPDREAVLARELSKAFETISRAPLAELASWVVADSNQQRGEIVLLVAGSDPREQSLDPLVAGLLERLAQELPPKRAAALVADVYGLRKNALYDYLLQKR